MTDTIIRSTTTTQEHAEEIARRVNSYGWRNQVSYIGGQPAPSMRAWAHDLCTGFNKVTITVANDDFAKIALDILGREGVLSPYGTLISPTLTFA
jgi:hypothetical protein